MNPRTPAGGAITALALLAAAGLTSRSVDELIDDIMAGKSATDLLREEAMRGPMHKGER